MITVQVQTDLHVNNQEPPFFLVHPTDTVRIDLKIPPDQYIYLRAATPAERQQWLVALGTAKACLTTMKHNGHSEMPGQCKEIHELHLYCVLYVLVQF